jgi:hypothetical protein
VSTPNPTVETTPGPDAADTAHHPEPAEFPKVTSSSPQPQGPGSSGEAPIGGDSTEMLEEIPLKWALWVADTLAKDPDFIKAGFHVGGFITTAVDTEKEQAVTKALKCNLEFALEQIKVCASFLIHSPAFLSTLISFFLHQLIEHSRSKEANRGSTSAR